MVLDQGKIVELDSPTVLLQNKSGIFYSMAADAGLLNSSTLSTALTASKS